MRNGDWSRWPPCVGAKTAPNVSIGRKCSTFGKWDVSVAMFYTPFRSLRLLCTGNALDGKVEVIMRRHVQVWLVLVGCALLAVEAADFSYQKHLAHSKDAHVEVTKRLGWSKTHDEDLTAIDADILPDYWELQIGALLEVDPRVPTNGAEPPEQLVKVTDRRHKFPVFATICSISFLATVVTLLIVCTS